MLQISFVILATLVSVILLQFDIIIEEISALPMNFTFAKILPDPASQLQILEPEGIEVDTNGDIYVNDIESNSIKKFSKDGTDILSWGSTGSGDGQFNHPHGNEIDKEGNIYITDQGNSRVQKFTNDGKFITRSQTIPAGAAEYRGAGAEWQMVRSASSMREVELLGVQQRPEEVFQHGLLRVG